MLHTAPMGAAAEQSRAMPPVVFTSTYGAAVLVKDNNVSFMLKLVGDSTPKELFFVSLLIFPTILGAYISLLKSVVSEPDPCGLALFSGAIWGAYVLTLYFAKQSQSAEQHVLNTQLDNDRRAWNIAIFTYQRLIKRKNRKASVDALVDNSDHIASHGDIEEVIRKFPLHFVQISLKGGVKGVQLVSETHFVALATQALGVFDPLQTTPKISHKQAPPSSPTHAGDE